MDRGGGLGQCRGTLLLLLPLKTMGALLIVIDVFIVASSLQRQMGHTHDVSFCFQAVRGPNQGN